MTELLEWKTILGFSVTSGIVTFLLNFIHSSYKDRVAKMLETQHGALKVALAFERYAIQCARLLSDLATWRASHENDGATFSEIPELMLPDKIEWKYLRTDLANRAMAFQNTIDYANGFISWSISYFSSDEDNDVPELQAGYCGYEAFLLAKDFRDTYSLPDEVPHSPLWNHGEILFEWYEKQLKKIEDLRATAE